jgi:hypothetical protein
MIKVLIVEISTNKCVATPLISYQLVGGQTALCDVYDEAWRTAVEDGLVDEKNRGGYKFSASNE